MAKCWIELDPDSRPDALLKLSGSETPGFKGDEEGAERASEGLREELVALQERLFAQETHKVLVVLLAMDTGGKDGAIRKVFSGVNPQGVEVARFAAPTATELAHDYLWRVHQRVPAKGKIVVFNRSHYEDVLVARVTNLVPRAVWKKRYAHLRHFERMLVDEGTTILKFFLHIDAEEQRERLQARLDEPQKHWKFDEHDLEQRKHWKEYMHAFRDAIVKTHHKDAPWFVIPANRKWFRDYAMLTIIVDALKKIDPQFPQPTFDPATIKVV
ncbi:MAG: polyphosphate kinase 2 family protein [Lautropia sp.]|nr:polyphosphate kinase 2 family protein [Lautropia sp.]